MSNSNRSPQGSEPALAAAQSGDLFSSEQVEADITSRFRPVHRRPEPAQPATTSIFGSGPLSPEPDPTSVSISATFLQPMLSRNPGPSVAEPTGSSFSFGGPLQAPATPDSEATGSPSGSEPAQVPTLPLFEFTGTPPQSDFDPHGDVLIGLTSTSPALGTITTEYRADSHVLRLASPVFNAMLGPNSGFKEAVDLKEANAVGCPMKLTLQDDDAEALKIILRLIHYQSDTVPRVITALQAYQIAVICDKYDMRKAIGPWAEHIWAPRLIPPHHEVFDDMERWLYISFVFGLKDLFRACSRELILSRTPPLEYVPEKLLAALEAERLKHTTRMLDCTKALLNDYISGNKCQQGSLAECDAVMLGSIVQSLKKVKLFPLPDPTEFEDCILILRSMLGGLSLPTPTPKAHRCSTHVSTPAFGAGTNSAFISGTTVFGQPQRECCLDTHKCFPSTHFESCSPLPAFRARIATIGDGIKGLEYDSFVSKKVSSPTTPAKCKNKKLPQGKRKPRME